MNRHVPMTKEDDTRETPPELFKELDRRFHFDCDACASHSNALCDMYFTEDGTWGKMPSGPVKISDREGLSACWQGRRVFFNPPFTQIAAFAAKAWESGADLVYAIIPATRTEQPWWHDLVEPYRDGKSDSGTGLSLTTEFMLGRKHFLVDGGPIMRKNKDGSTYLKNGKPVRSSPKFGLVGLLWLPSRKGKTK